MPVQVAAPLAVLVSITVAVVVVIQDWRNVHVRSAGWLVLSTLFGIPLGLLLLKTVPESVVKAILGAFIIAFALYSLTGRKPELHNDRLAPLFGFSAGILGGAYGMNGPPLVVYGVLRRWQPAQFRATLQGYFLIASVVGMAGYAITGLMDPRRQQLLSAVAAAGSDRDLPRPRCPSPPEQLALPDLRQHRPGADRCPIVKAGSDA